MLFLTFGKNESAMFFLLCVTVRERRFPTGYGARCRFLKYK